MSLNPELFIHPTDRAAMKALKAIPGFNQFVKMYMNIWNERQFRIINMSSKLKVSEKQMKKYYDMLPPICEKLGIAVPELYLELDVNPNAYTYGDKDVFIVLTSGLFETMPDNLIRTILAHECGHIACHHTMYTTMGRMILKGVANIPGAASLVTMPLQIAFAYWMRCSEFSADRAATICDGSSDKMIEVCMRLAGYDKEIQEEGSVEAFMEQAEEYREMVADSKWNKTLEFILFNQMDHPLNAVRAYECREWGKSEQYGKICQYIEKGDSENLYVREAPVPLSAKDFVGMDLDRAVSEIVEAGFVNVIPVRTIETQKGIGERQITSVTISGTSDFGVGDWFNDNAEIIVTYFEAETREEAIKAHQGKIPIPDSARKYSGRKYEEVVRELSDAGYTNIIAEAQKTKKTLFTKDGTIVRVTIAGQGMFEKGDWFEPDAIIRISYVKLV